MPGPVDLLAPLRARLRKGIAALAPGLADHGLVSLLLTLPSPPTAAPQLPGRQFQFRHGDRGEQFVGWGVAAEWAADGPGRLAGLAAVARRLGGRWQRLDPDGSGLDAFAMLGFAAATEAAPVVEDQLPNALLWVPELGLISAGPAAALVFSAPLPTTPATLAARWEPALTRVLPALYAPAPAPLPPALPRREFAEPDRHGWDALVEAAVMAIAAGTFEKVVVSRRLDLQGQRPFDLGRLLGALACLFPSCQVICLRRNGSSFVAATPERLLTLRGRLLEVDAIAGTGARARDPVADAALGAALLASDKNRHEHQVVIDAVRAALAGCEDFSVPDRPVLMPLNNAWHLWSPIRARVPAGLDLFDLAERLHPTPATNGQPREAARAWLAGAEPFARGWYTGAAGILRPDLSGELWVLLRCARLCGNRAELYAGAGIVSGSDAESEWLETEAKLGAVLTALQYA